LLLATTEQVLRLYREPHRDFNVAYFTDPLRDQHGIRLSYQWIKTALPTAGLVWNQRTSDWGETGTSDES